MTKEKLVEMHRYLVVNAATRYYAKYKKYDSLTLEDMINMGFVGLLEAANNFNGNRKNKFATFAFNRIRGNILDETNKFLSINKMKKYGVSLLNISDEEIAELPDIRAEEAFNAIYKKELLSYIDYSINRFLTKREKEAINLKYKNGLKEIQIAKHMEISKQRVTTLLKAAIKKLKKRVNLNVEKNRRKRKPPKSKSKIFMSEL